MIEIIRWTKMEESLLIKLLESKEDWDTISKELGKTIAACKQKVKRLRAAKKKCSNVGKVSVTISYEGNSYTFKIKESELKTFILNHI